MCDEHTKIKGYDPSGETMMFNAETDNILNLWNKQSNFLFIWDTFSEFNKPFHTET